MTNNKEILRRATKYSKVHKKKKRLQRIIMCFAAVVVLCTAYVLILPAVALGETAYCGIEEHEHGEECYNKTLVCGKEETGGTTHAHSSECYTQQKELICVEEEGEATGHVHTEECYTVKDVLQCGLEDGETLPGHTHTGTCYESAMACGKSEHTHGLTCYSNPKADVETSKVWEGTVSDVELTGEWCDDVIAVAESQLGYTESSKNYVVDENERKKGYTRYGDWYGDSYGDWCAMFVSFCLHYAEIDELPYEASCARWVEELQKEESNYYRAREDYVPKKGDLIFFDWNDDKKANHIGLVVELLEATDTEPAKIRTIEGNSDDCVQYVTYDQDDTSILGYGELPERAAVEYSWSQDGVEVVASLRPKEELPENTNLVVKELSSGDVGDTYAERYNEVREEVLAKSETDVSRFDLYNVSLEADGKEIVPQCKADIEIKLLADQYPAISDTELLSFSENGAEMLELNPDVSGNVTGSFDAQLSAEYAVAKANHSLYSLRAGAGNAGQNVTISHHKRIDAFRDKEENPDTELDNNTQIDQTDLHRLYLDAVVGEVKNPVDLLIVVDQSGSMHMNYQTIPGTIFEDTTETAKYKDMKNENGDWIFRDEAVRLVLNGTYNENEYESKKQNGLIYQFLQMNKENNVAVVEFHGESYGTNDFREYPAVENSADKNPDASVLPELGWTKTAKYVNVGGIKASATNYCAGLIEADDILKDSQIKNNGHKKVMLFISDGVPTVYLKKDEDNKYWKAGVGHTSTEVAPGYESADVSAYNTGTINYFNQFMAGHQNDGLAVYTVGISKDINNKNDQTGSHSPIVLEHMAEKGGGKFFGVEKTEDFRKVLNMIINETSCKSLVIKDPLSQYVDLYNEQPDYKVTMKKAGEPEIVLYENGEVTSEGKERLSGVTYDDSTKTVSAVFEPTYKLEQGYTYTLSFNVKTTQDAYDHHAENPYPHTGDDDTDYGYKDGETEIRNDTSSLKPGYYSNESTADKKATVSYVIGEERKEEEYQHPVVQVTDRELKVKKKWLSYNTGQDVTNIKNGEVEFKLYQNAYPISSTSSQDMVNVTLNSRRVLAYNLGNYKTENGSDAVLTFQIYSSSFSHLLVGNQRVEKTDKALENTGNTYTYRFKVSGETTIYIVYENRWKEPTNAKIEFTPPTQDPISTPYKNKTYKLTSDNSWESIFKNLPQTGKLEDGTEVYYTYVVKEVSVSPDEYEVSYENNDGITTGTITVTNRALKPPSYELPKTGGSGITMYTMGGLLLIVAAGILLLYKKSAERRKLRSSDAQ